jgi:unsaturated chondroitin disaccharide hydrolase
MTSRTHKCERTYEFAAYQLRCLNETYPDHFPMYTERGKWMHGGEAWTNWCEGFLGGQLWLLYAHTQDAYWRDKAIHYSRLIEPRKNDRTVHDLGFLFWPTWRRWYEQTGEAAVNDVVVQAGQTLALRFKEKGQTPGWEGILKHGVYHTARGLGVDESVMWGEYFFLEAVGKALSGG